MPTAALVGTSLLGAVVGRNASKRSAKAQTRGQENAQAAIDRAAELARSQAIPLFNSAQQNQQLGFQGALDIFGQTIPAQLDAFGGGNLNAQNTMLAGLDPQIAAILGGNIDLSGLQSQQVQQPDPSMFQRQLPEFESINDALGVNQSSSAQAPPGTFINDNPQLGFDTANIPFFNIPGQQQSAGNALGGQQVNPFEQTGISNPDINIPFGRLI